VNAAQFATEKTGVITIKDILSELEKPGRDPRPEFKFAEFQEGVESISDLRPNMVLEGAITNVAAFGAFVDIGVHQDGLVHISALSDTFVKDPRDVVKAGDIVKVKVMEVDAPRKRIGLSMRMSDDANERAAEKGSHANKAGKSNRGKGGSGRQNKTSFGGNNNAQGAMAAAFANAKKR
ncbi:MAG: S1 RNA-binding domain-containing protein, partial [Oceanobacter sp.]